MKNEMQKVEIKTRTIRPIESYIPTLPKTYEDVIKHFLKFYSDINIENIRDYLDSKTDKNFSPETINKRVKAFISLFKKSDLEPKEKEIILEALGNERIDIDHEATENYHEKDEVLRVIQYLETTPTQRTGKRFDKDDNLKLSLIIKFLYLTGLRFSEMAKIKKGDLKKNGVVKFEIIGKGKKSRKKQISNDLCNQIESIFNVRESQYLFHNTKGFRLSQSVIFRKINKVFKLVVGKHSGIHTLRHTYATQLLKSGIDIKTISEELGHRSGVSFTAKIYIHTKPNPIEIEKALL